MSTTTKTKLINFYGPDGKCVFSHAYERGCDVNVRGGLEWLTCDQGKQVTRIERRETEVLVLPNGVQRWPDGTYHQADGTTVYYATSA